MSQRILMPKVCFPKELGKLKVVGGKQVWRSDCGKRLYTWDELHGEVEVFNKRGKHLGVENCLGIIIKEAVVGRSIDVQ